MDKGVSLTSYFCGVYFENPFLLSSSCITNKGDMISAAFEQGWAGAVFKTLNSGYVVMQQPSPRMSTYRGRSNEILGIQNVEQISDRALRDNLRDLKDLKKRFPDKVIIASIMGFSTEDWQLLAKAAEDNGVDLIECNFSCPNMAIEGSGSDISQNYHLLEQFTEKVKESVSIPVLAKLTPNITDITVPARYAKKGGADGITAINTVAGISHIDLDNFTPSPNIAGYGAVSGHSGPMIKPIGLRMVAELASADDINIPISGVGGIETWMDAVEYLSVGAHNVQITTAVINYGYRIIEDLIDGLSDFLIDSEINNVEDLVGAALPRIVSTECFDLSKQGEAVFNLENCLGCGRCYIACQDAGSGRLIWNAEKRVPELNNRECYSCMACQFVCPASDVIYFKY